MSSEQLILPQMQILTYGLDEVERALCYALLPEFYRQVHCDGDFQGLVTGRPVCMLLDPLALEREQAAALEHRCSGDDGTIILLTREPERPFRIPAFPIRLRQLRRRSRPRVIRLLERLCTSPIQDISFGPPKDISQPMNGAFVLLDLEASHGSAYAGEIIFLSAVRVVNGQPADSWQTLVRTKRPIPPDVVELTGITNEMASAAPPLREAMEHLVDWYPEDPLAVFDFQFIAEFLRFAQEETGVRFQEGRAALDLENLAARLHPVQMMRHKKRRDWIDALLSETFPPETPDIEKYTRLMRLLNRELEDQYHLHTIQDIEILYKYLNDGEESE